jgi:hypothetical protein
MRTHRRFQAVLYLAVLTAAIVSTVHCYSVGGPLLVFFAFLWGAGVALGMRSGVERASIAARPRNRTVLRSLFEYLLVGSFILLPAIISAFWLNLLGCLAVAIVVVVSMSVAIHLMSLVFGEMEVPGHLRETTQGE